MTSVCLPFELDRAIRRMGLPPRIVITRALEHARDFPSGLAQPMKAVVTRSYDLPSWASVRLAMNPTQSLAAIKAFVANRQDTGRAVA